MGGLSVSGLGWSWTFDGVAGSVCKYGRVCGCYNLAKRMFKLGVEVIPYMIDALRRVPDNGAVADTQAL